jgi:plastocyanin
VRRPALALGANLLAVAFAVALLGLAIGPTAAGTAPSPPPKLSRVLDDYYSPVSLTVSRGGSVKWVWPGSNLHPHNLRLAKAPNRVDKARFRSPTKVRRFSFVRAFTIAGSYEFFCTLHPFTMRQTVTVRR